MKIVVLEGNAVNPGDLSWECLNCFGQVTVYPRTSPEEAVARIGDAQILLTNKIPVTSELLDACPTIALICVLATGYNVIDCQAARSRNIPVCNVPAYGTDAVAQFTFALLLEACNWVGHHDQAVHRGDWCTNPDFCMWQKPQMELAGKTMGIIGFGRIGRAVGRIARAFGMRVLAYSRSRCPEGLEIGEYVELDTLLAQSDIVSLHCPQTPDTIGIINTETISKMKDGAILLNTARGALVDENALAAAMKAGKLRCYCADVVSQEPILPNTPLLTAPNCILTSHMAWAPVETRQRIIDITVKNIEAFLAGNPVNLVN